MPGSFLEQRSGCDPSAIAAREAEVAGKPQRVAELKPEELSDDALELTNRIRLSAGGTPVTRDNIPGYMRTIAKHMAIFRGQLEFGTAIFKGQIPARERELAVLRIGWLMRAPYEWGEHVDISKRYGVTDEEVVRVIDGSSAPGWSGADAALLRAVEEMLSEQSVCDATWAKLAERWDDAQLIEFVTLVGQYAATAMVQNTLRIRLADDNPGLTHR